MKTEKLSDRSRRLSYLSAVLPVATVVLGGAVSTPASADFMLQAPSGTPGLIQDSARVSEVTSSLSTRTRTISQQEFAQTAIQQLPILTRLQEWRETARGQGIAPQRQWTLLGSEQASLKLQVGKQNLPAYGLLGSSGQSPAIAAEWGLVSFGSTVPLLALNQSLRPVDELLAPPATPSASAKPPVGDQSHLTWLAANPLQSQQADLSLVLARGQRDLAPQVNDANLVDGTWLGAKARMDLATDWKLNGEWMRGQLDSGTDASSWKLALNGPIAHRWGVARFNSSFSDRDTSYTSWRDGLAQGGLSSREMSLQQDVAHGALNGMARLAFRRQVWPGQQHNAEQESINQSDTNLQGEAQWNWNPSTEFSIKGAHLFRGSQRALPEATSAETASADDASLEVRHDQASSSNHELTAQWKPTETLALEVTAGQSRVEGSEQADSAKPLSDEDRLALRLQQRLEHGILQLSLARRETRDPLDEKARFQSDSLKMETKQQLLPWLSFKSGIGVENSGNASEREMIDNWIHRSRAQLAVPYLGQFALVYGDSEVGAEWKTSGNFAFQVATSQVAAGSTPTLTPGAQPSAPIVTDEERLSLGVQHRRKNGAWQLSLTQKEAVDPLAQNVPLRSGTLKIEAEQQLLSWLRVKGGLGKEEAQNALNDDVLERWQRRAEAQLALARLGQVAFLYSDGVRPEGFVLDGVRIDNREYGVRYNVGSSPQESGLGLSVEYSRRAQPTMPDDSRWRLGVTYR